MRVLFDNTGFDFQIAGGISRYFAELIGAMRRHKLADAKTSFYLSSNIHLLDQQLPRLWRIPPGLRGRYRINDATSKLAIAAGRFDVFHMTYYEIDRVERLRRPLVVTVYDMIPELFPDSFPDPKAVHPNKKLLCDRADAILCISHNTRADLLRLYDGIDPEKTWVTPLGIDPDWARRARPFAGLPDSFILYVGRREPYKAFGLLVDAFARISRHYPQLFLFCVGGGAFSPSEASAITARGVAERILQRNLGDAELAYCYGKAHAFVFPSLYEGFGLSILEAFVSRCPVILADRSCFPEVAGEAAAFFDPDQPDSLTNALLRILGDAAHRQDLIARGERRAAEFSAYNTAAETVAVYQRLLDG